MIARRIVFSGRVQGVGFRQTTRSLASGFPVGGFVRNLPDGDVENYTSYKPIGHSEEFPEPTAHFGCRSTAHWNSDAALP